MKILSLQFPSLTPNYYNPPLQSRPDIEELLTKAREFVSQLAYPRFPHPRVSVVEDGTSMNRLVGGCRVCQWQLVLLVQGCSRVCQGQ